MDAALSPALIFFALALHPFTTYPLSLLAFPKRPRPVAAPADAPLSIALVFACHNEEQALPAKLANLRLLLDRYQCLRVYIYLDQCTDRSAALLAEFDRPLTVVQGRERAGKNHGLNILCADLSEDLIAFNDANVIIDPDAFSRVQTYFEDPAIGLVNARQLTLDGGSSETAAAGGLYWRFEEWLKAQESLRGSTPAVDGSLFLIRRALFQPLPADTPNDFYTSLDLLTGGHRVVSAPDVLCFEKAATSPRDEFRRKVRIATRAVTCHLRLRARLRQMPLALQYAYVSHKLLRWFTLHWLLLGLASLGLYTWTLGLLLPFALTLIGGVALWASLHRLGVGPARQVTAIIAAFAATALGATYALCGTRTAVWAIPQSSRQP